MMAKEVGDVVQRRGLREERPSASGVAKSGARLPLDEDPVINQIITDLEVRHLHFELLAG
jgi:hypothetical protein